MKTINGYIQKAFPGEVDAVETDMLVTYDSNEQEENKVNRVNAKVLFTPEFIPYYPSVQKTFSLSPLETLVYGFIRFYLGSGESKEFYFTNEQLSKILNCSEGGIANAVKSLRDKKVVEFSYKKSQSGTFRKVSHLNSVEVRTSSFDDSHLTKRLTRTSSFDEPNNNSKYIIINNKSNKFLETFNEFKKMRTKIKSSLTQRAEELILSKLEKLSSNEEEQIRILEQSIMNSWKGVFALNDKKSFKSIGVV